MSLEDVIKFERKKVKKLVPFYRWKQRRELVQTFDSMLDNCENNEVSLYAAEVVGRIANKTTDSAITLEACQALDCHIGKKVDDLGVDQNYSEQVIELMNRTVELCDDVKAISSLSYILLYQVRTCNDDELQKLSRLTNQENHEPLIAFSNLLKRYSDKDGFLVMRDLIFNSYKEDITSQQLKGIVTFLDEYLETGRDIDPRTFGVTLEALTLYQDDHSLVPVWQKVGDPIGSSAPNLKDSVSKVVYAIIKNSVKSGAIAQTSECLVLYHDHKEKGKVLSYLYNNSLVHLWDEPYILQHPAIFEEVDKYIDNQKLLYLFKDMVYFSKIPPRDLRDLRDNFVKREKDYSQHYSAMNYFYRSLYLKISDRELADNVSVPEIKLLIEAYDFIYHDVTVDWNIEYRPIANQAFFDVLNDKVSSGKTLREKRDILRQWCSNVQDLIKDNLDDLMFNQPTAQYTNQQMGVVA